MTDTYDRTTDLRQQPGVCPTIRPLRGVARARAYRWLAERMGIEVPDCHVAMFDVFQCRQAYRILRDERPTAVTIRAWAQARKVAQGATSR